LKGAEERNAPNSFQQLSLRGLINKEESSSKMKKELRIKRNQDFQTIFQKGRSFANRQFVVYCLEKEGQTDFRIGLSVSKKLGNAVTRNRIKRYIRQAIFELKDQLAYGNDYVIIARKPAADMDFFEIKNSLIHVLKVGKVLKKNL
jgi:ribonuclease P protein component